MRGERLLRDRNGNGELTTQSGSVGGTLLWMDSLLIWKLGLWRSFTWTNVGAARKKKVVFILSHQDTGSYGILVIGFTFFSSAAVRMILFPFGFSCCPFPHLYCQLSFPWDKFLLCLLLYFLQPSQFCPFISCFWVFLILMKNCATDFRRSLSINLLFVSLKENKNLSPRQMV